MFFRALTALALAAALQIAFDERAAFFEPVLAPQPGVTADIPADLQARKPKDIAEAAAAFDRGMAFVQQGAWKEAEKELHTAEKKTDDKAQKYVFAAAYAYLKLHRADDALKRYERIYRKEPVNRRAILGMAAAYEDMQHYADAVRIWLRYTKTSLSAPEKMAADKMLAGARELFAKYYEIADNPAGGAKNLATPEQEMAWGLGYAQQLGAAGYSPDGLVGMFRTFESMSPSSRNTWDLMTRTHPFSIDRVNAVTDYSALLPARPARAASPAFARMKTRLAGLPPPADTVGLMKSGTALPAPAPPAPPPGATRSFTIDNAPLAGEIPADWGARKTESGTIVFEGPKGTDAYEVSVELEVVPKSNVQRRTVVDVAQAVAAQLSQRSSASIKPLRTGQTARGQATVTVSGAYTMQAQSRTVPFKHVSPHTAADNSTSVMSVKRSSPQSALPAGGSSSKRDGGHYEPSLDGRHHDTLLPASGHGAGARRPEDGWRRRGQPALPALPALPRCRDRSRSRDRSLSRRHRRRQASASRPARRSGAAPADPPSG